MAIVAALALSTVAFAAPLFAGGSVAAQEPAGDRQESALGASAVDLPGTDIAREDAATAVFAGGCFWCMEEAFEKVPGVVDAVSGFAGGDVANPSYYEVVSGETGHTEVVQVLYDPEVVSYDDLLYVFWRNVDLLDPGGQFCDRGESYRTGIFYATEAERQAAEASKREIEESGRFQLPPATEITQLDAFYEAEDYHQDFYKNQPTRYTFYKDACGRDARLDELWGDEAGGFLPAIP
jgi:peptide-methionine (S)-S-oxide reductase